MALIVEDGTGLSNAESYISVADADIYVSSYKGTDALWDAATTTQKEIAARKATQYLDDSYNWKGEPYLSTQSLAWPRSYVYDERGFIIAGIPEKLKQAQVEAMFLLINGNDLTVNVTRSDQVKRERIEGAIEVEYMGNAASQPVYPNVSRLLKGLYFSSGTIVRG